MSGDNGTEYAWVHLTRLCGCNYKQPITRQGESVYVTDPQGTHKYRLDAAKFDANEFQSRGSWSFSPWGERAERAMVDEADWQS